MHLSSGRQRLSLWSGGTTRSLVALTFLSAGGGCYVSVPVPHGEPYKAYATTAPSNVQIAIGKTTKNEANHLLGDPFVHTNDDTVWMYQSLVTKAIGLWLPIIIPVHGGSIQPEKSEYKLFLIFDQNDILSDYEVIVDYDDHQDSKTLTKETKQNRANLRHLSSRELTAYKVR